MPSRLKRFFKVLLLIAAALLVAFAVFFFFFAAGLAADLLNPVVNKPPYTVSEKAKALHEKLLVADMHADSLLWNRDLTARNSGGHVDLPRMQEGNLALQAFTVVTKSPRWLNIEKNDDKTDDIYLVALAQRQPWENLSSLTKRALWQAGHLHSYAERSQGKLVVIKNKKDLREFLERRKTEKITGGWLGIEGAHALDGDLDNIDALYDAGFRMMSPSHFFDNDIGGSAHGLQKYGLTDKGREMVRRMEAKGMTLDVAHASTKTIDDVLAMAALAGGGFTHRRARHLRQQPQLDGRPVKTHRGDRRCYRHRFLAHGGLRRRRGGDRQGYPLHGRSGRRRARCFGVGF